MKTFKFTIALGLIFGLSVPAWSAGQASKDECIALVKKAVALVKADGADKAYAAFDDKAGGFVDRDLYILVYGMNGHVLAHGANAKLIGKDMNDAQDVDGKYYVKERIALASKQASFWQDYKFVNPTSKKIEPKEAYCERLNDSIVCSGVYKK